MDSRKPERQTEELRAALAALVAEDLPVVLDDARRQARQRAAALLAEAMTEALLESAATRERPVAEPTAETAAHPDALGLYLYCVTHADAVLPPALASIDPRHAPTLIEDGELAAVVSEVPLADFDEERLREHLGDMAWLEATARAHEAVLDAIGERETLVPMRLCTIYRGESGVREMLLREQVALKDALAHLEAKSEWGVKVFATEAGPATTEAPAGDPDDAGATGTAYLRGRQAERDRREHRYEELHEVCAEIHARLSAVAADAITAPPQRRELSGRDGEMLLNGVYLVEDEELTRFMREVEQVTEGHRIHGLEIEPTGPWPAYNFVPGTIGAAW